MSFVSQNIQRENKKRDTAQQKKKKSKTNWIMLIISTGYWNFAPTTVSTVLGRNTSVAIVG